jgi:hypothetical protein
MPKEEIFGILAIATCDSSGGEVFSELQLIKDNGISKSRYLLATSMGSYIPPTFGRQLREFCDATNIPGYIAEREGLLKRGKLVVRTYKE